MARPSPGVADAKVWTDAPPSKSAEDVPPQAIELVRAVMREYMAALLICFWSDLALKNCLGRLVGLSQYFSLRTDH